MRAPLEAVGAALVAVSVWSHTAHAQPCPPGRAPCDAMCCAAGEACREGACRGPSGRCADAAACAAGEFCDPIVEACYPPDALPLCEVRPPVGPFDPVVEWGWHGSEVLPQFANVMMTPIVVQLTDDDGDGRIDHHDTPDVVFSTYVSGGSHAEEGVLRAVSGDDGRPIFDVDDPDARVNGLGAIAAGDIDGDGLVEIVTSRFIDRGVWASGLRAFENDGTLKWTTAEPWPIGWGGPALADLDGDGAVEVIAGRVVLDGATGALRCQVEGPGGQGDHDGRRPLSFPVDLDGDGRQELVTGNAVYDADCRPVWVGEGRADGFPAVADFDGDGDPEIVVVHSGGVSLYDHRGGRLARTDVAGANDPGGAPTIADFDGDGRLEFASAGSARYVVYKPNAALDAIDVLWSAETRDGSSRVTGSSVFDFEADGEAEVVYGDECYLRVYRGRDGRVLAEIPNPSGTTYEYPVIVDVDRDGRAEIIAVANGTGCSCPWAPQPAETCADQERVAPPGVRVFADRRGNWVGTRAIWNQHAYSISNVCDGRGDVCEGAEDVSGAIPRRPLANWRLPWANNFRQNVQGAGVYDAPDLMPVRVQATARGCPPEVDITFDLFNQGREAVLPGVAVTLYDAAGEPVAETRSTRRLEPGESESFTFAADALGALHVELGVTLELALVVDDARGVGAYQECDELNNEARLAIDVPLDGDVAPVACGTGAAGICAVGTRLCVGGAEGCPPDEEARAEVCNALDDDCDGVIDEGLRDGCGRCGDDPLDGCDAIDDDCDGALDEDADCPDGGTCLGGVCRVECINNECPGFEVCADGFCLEPCDLLQCDGGLVCVGAACSDPCEDVACPEGERCAGGVCGPDVCAHTGCPPDQRCGLDGCVPDPCADIDCPAGDFCRAGACVASCAEVSCAFGMICVDGRCADDPCHAAECAPGERCLDGACRPACDPPCPDGALCLDGCVEDPCAAIECPPGQGCDLDPHGRARCVWPPLDPAPLPDGEPTPDAGPAADASDASDASDATFDVGDYIVERRCIFVGVCDAGDPSAEAAATPEGCACSAPRGSSPPVFGGLLIGLLWVTRRRMSARRAAGARSFACRPRR